MDPNETLRVIREECVAALDESDAFDAGRLAEHVTALDEWLSKGGFLPAAWAR